jgi:hypothetical protein
MTTPTRWLVGLDLGQAQDYSALAAVHQTYRSGAWHFDCRHLQRWPLGTDYCQVVLDLCNLLTQPPLRGGTLVVDGTGCGRPVCDLIAKQRLPGALVRCTITAGVTSGFSDGFWGVSKRELVSTLVLLLGAGRLHIAEGLPLAAVLQGEFDNFRAKVNAATGNESFEAWREGQHDDILLALILAIWYGELMPPALGDVPDALLVPGHVDAARAYATPPRTGQVGAYGFGKEEEYLLPPLTPEQRLYGPR